MHIQSPIRTLVFPFTCIYSRPYVHSYSLYSRPYVPSYSLLHAYTVAHTYTHIPFYMHMQSPIRTLSSDVRRALHNVTTASNRVVSLLNIRFLASFDSGKFLSSKRRERNTFSFNLTRRLVTNSARTLVHQQERV
jgi:hypothetical protein